MPSYMPFKDSCLCSAPIKPQWPPYARTFTAPRFRVAAGAEHNADHHVPRIPRPTMLRHDTSSLRHAFTGIMLAAISCLVTGCSDGISEADVAFVTARTPPQFESLRMYGAAPDSIAPGSGNAHTSGRLHQGCQAIIRSRGRHVREVVIFEDEPGTPFDLDVTRTPNGWSVTSDGLTPPSADPVGFRTRFTSCVNAIRDKYAAEPEEAPFK